MVDRSDQIAERVLRTLGNLQADEPIGRQQHLMRVRLTEILTAPETLEVMAMAADAEEAAQKGEPSPWRADIAGQDEEWKAERRCAMLCALKAVGLA